MSSELAQILREKYTSFTFYYYEKDVKNEQLVILPKEWKTVKKEIVKHLRSKKESSIKYKNWWYELEMIYRWPTKEDMFKYYKIDEFKTGMHITIKSKDNTFYREIPVKEFI